MSLAGLGALSRRAVAGMLAVAFGCGVVVSAARVEASPLEAIAHEVPRCAISARVVETVTASRTLVAIDALDCKTVDIEGPVGLAVVDNRVLDAGARIEGQGYVVPLGSGPSDAVARRAGAVAELDVGELSVGPPAGAFVVAARLRSSLRAATDPVNPDRAAVMHGLAIGDTSQIDPVAIQWFRAAGLSHLLAVSGSNVAIVLAVGALLMRRRSLRLRVALGAMLLATFVLVVGPDPSVLRAAAMGALALVALLSGRKIEPLRALGVAILVVVALRPQMVHAVGLHLSAAATAGIVLLGARLAEMLVQRRCPRVLAIVLGATLSAQLAVAPILIATFGELSIIAPLANVVVAPAVPPATILTLGSGLGRMIHPLVGSALARAAEPFAAWILEGAELFGSLELALVELPRFVGLAAALPVGWVLLRAARRVDG